MKTIYFCIDAFGLMVRPLQTVKALQKVADFDFYWLNTSYIIEFLDLIPKKSNMKLFSL